MAANNITTKGQVTIPKSIRDILGIKPGDKVVFFQHSDGRIIVEAKSVDVRNLRGMLKYSGRPITVEEMNAAIAREAAS